MYRNAWADHANLISVQYAGTGALKTDYTRTGVRTKFGLAQASPVLFSFTILFMFGIQAPTVQQLSLWVEFFTRKLPIDVTDGIEMDNDH